jgi:integrative and conjugative element protein (TIGR02256 family)
VNKPIEILLHPTIAKTLGAAAEAAEPQETGGILLGWWDAECPVIRNAVEVSDPASTRTSWTRHETTTQAALEKARAVLEHPWLGYVGDWHTHPEPCGASAQDQKSISEASRSYPHPLVLIVHQPGGDLDLLVAHRGKIRKDCAIAYAHDSETTPTVIL